MPARTSAFVLALLCLIVGSSNTHSYSRAGDENSDEAGPDDGTDNTIAANLRLLHEAARENEWGTVSAHLGHVAEE